MVVVSVRPGQEPRFLVPVLERALGVPVRGWLRVRDDRYIRLGTGPEAGARTGPDAVRRTADGAALVVLHGLHADAPTWALERLRRAPAVLVFPGDPVPAGLPVELGPAADGDWYVDPAIPSSPVASLLAGLDASTAPPLTDVRAARLPPGFWTPLTVRRGRSGTPAPAVAVGRDGGRRVAVATGAGYWRWAFSGPTSRSAYERLWSAVGSWLVDAAAAGADDGVRPVERVVARGRPVRWALPAGLDSATVRIRPEAAAGSASASGAGPAAAGDDSVAVRVETVHGARAETRPLPPGHYRYQAEAGGDVVGVGGFTVASRSPEFTRPPVALELESGDDSAERAEPGSGRPLRALPGPWILLVLLLAAEWVLRRRWGLR